jgi:hypothetical protein
VLLSAGANTALILGASLGVVGGLLLIACCAFWCFWCGCCLCCAAGRRRREKREKERQEKKVVSGQPSPPPVSASGVLPVRLNPLLTPKSSSRKKKVAEAETPRSKTPKSTVATPYVTNPLSRNEAAVIVQVKHVQLWAKASMYY